MRYGAAEIIERACKNERNEENTSVRACVDQEESLREITVGFLDVFFS